jgi:hypothetical protein
VWSDSTPACFLAFRLLNNQNDNAAINITATATPAPTPAAIPAESFEEPEFEEGFGGASVTIIRPEVVIVDVGDFVGFAPLEVEVRVEIDVLIGPMPA